MENQAVDTDTKRVVLESFATLYPWMRSFHTRPVRDYAVRLFDFSGSRSGPEPRLRSFTKLLKAIQRAGRRNGLSSNAVAKICEEFEARPVMQTGPHLLLLIEPEAYYSHVFSLLGLSAHGCTSYVSYAVSTVNLVEKPRKGPGWLKVDGQPVNVFGLSRSQMIPYSLLSGPGSYRFELKTVDASVEGDALERLRNLLPKTQFERPAHALKAANLCLWPKLFGTDFTFLQIDPRTLRISLRTICQTGLLGCGRGCLETRPSLRASSQNWTSWRPGPGAAGFHGAPIFSGSMIMESGYLSDWSPGSSSIRQLA
ncbi:hypothetical protein [Sinorhizobium meliloti]|uniref:hypothetical protein n=1 Tax=Rhizobium meliloti TaxID=382 RepID=UPI0012970919|nr:hypothetical protein [Sinorhizobium meliloti]MQU96644.1 hypothetical protein [Sinorhizobium meliloti]